MQNIAVIGCGYWGPNHIRNLSALDESIVKSICDLNVTRLDHLQGMYPNIETTTQYEDIIRDERIDAVVIATPVGTHFRIALDCIESGKHVFIEKPMASSTRECDTLIQKAAEKKVRIMVGHTFLYTPAVRKIKEIIQSGDLGELLCINSRRLNLGLLQNDINVAWDLAPHDLSILLYILDEKPFSISCTGQSHYLDTIEDITSISLSFPNRLFASIQSSWLDPKKIREMTIVGTKKMIVYDDIEPVEKIRIYDKHVDAPSHYDTFAEFHYSYHYGDCYIPYIHQEEPLKIECQHFLDCIRENRNPLSDGMNGREVVRILEKADESITKNGQAIRM